MHFPKIIITHLSPKDEEQIKKEIKEVSKELNLPIDIACEGDIIKI